MDLKYEKLLAGDENVLMAVVQHFETLEVLMVGVMNRAAVKKTVETGRVTFWSRSQGKLWTKGETSGNYLLVKEILTDCDCDSLLIMVESMGPTCHTGARTCFVRLNGEERIMKVENEKAQDRCTRWIDGSLEFKDFRESGHST